MRQNSEDISSPQEQIQNHKRRRYPSINIMEKQEPPRRSYLARFKSRRNKQEQRENGKKNNRKKKQEKSPRCRRSNEQTIKKEVKTTTSTVLASNTLQYNSEIVKGEKEVEMQQQMAHRVPRMANMSSNHTELLAVCPTGLEDVTTEAPSKGLVIETCSTTSNSDGSTTTESSVSFLETATTDHLPNVTACASSWKEWIATKSTTVSAKQPDGYCCVSQRDDTSTKVPSFVVSKSLSDVPFCGGSQNSIVKETKAKDELVSTVEARSLDWKKYWPGMSSSRPTIGAFEATSTGKDRFSFLLCLGQPTWLDENGGCFTSPVCVSSSLSEPPTSVAVPADSVCTPNQCSPTTRARDQSASVALGMVDPKEGWSTSPPTLLSLAMKKSDDESPPALEPVPSDEEVGSKQDVMSAKISEFLAQLDSMTTTSLDEMVHATTGVSVSVSDAENQEPFKDSPFPGDEDQYPNEYEYHLEEDTPSIEMHAIAEQVATLGSETAHNGSFSSPNLIKATKEKPSSIPTGKLLARGSPATTPSAEASMIGDIDGIPRSKRWAAEVNQLVLQAARQRVAGRRPSALLWERVRNAIPTGDLENSHHRQSTIMHQASSRKKDFIKTQPKKPLQKPSLHRIKRATQCVKRARSDPTQINSLVGSDSDWEDEDVDDMMHLGLESTPFVRL